MYRRIASRMALMGWTKQDLARAMGMSYSTLLYKLMGRTAFKLEEAVRVKALLCAKEPLEELFEKGGIKP